MEPRNVNRSFDAARASAGIPWLSLHGLRHASGSYLLSQGVSMRTVIQILGHSTFRLTMDLYSHVLPDDLRAAADAMDRALGETSG